MGACYANGMSGDEIRKFLMDRFGHRKAIMASRWALRARSFGDLAGNGRPRLGELDLGRILQRLLG